MSLVVWDALLHFGVRLNRDDLGLGDPRTVELADPRVVQILVLVCHIR